MGSTQGVRDKLASNDTGWKNLIKQQQATMHTLNKDVVDGFGPYCDKFYKDNGWDQLIFGQGEKADLQEEYKFSLDEIAKVIGELANDILGGDISKLFDAPPDPNAETTPSKEVVTKVAASAEEFVAPAPALMVTAAVDCIKLVLGMFSESGDSAIESSYQSKRIAPGMMLHAYAFSALGDAQTVIEGSRIKTSAIGYRLVYSMKQSEAEDDISFMAAMSADLKEIEGTLNAMQKILDKMRLDPNTDDKKITSYASRISDEQKDLKTAQDMVAARTAAYKKA